MLKKLRVNDVRVIENLSTVPGKIPNIDEKNEGKKWGKLNTVRRLFELIKMLNIFRVILI